MATLSDKMGRASTFDIRNKCIGLGGLEFEEGAEFGCHLNLPC